MSRFSIRMLILTLSFLFTFETFPQFKDQVEGQEGTQPDASEGKPRRRKSHRSNRPPRRPPTRPNVKPAPPADVMNETNEPVPPPPPLSVSDESPPTAGQKISKELEPKQIQRRGKNYIQGLNVPGGIELTELIKLMSLWKNKNYILDDRVKGKIFIIGPFEITLEEAYQAFLSALEVKGFTIVDTGKVAKIVFTREARQYPVPFRTEGLPFGELIITQLIPIKYTSGAEIQRAIQPLVSKDGHLNVYTPTNTLIITDNGSNISRLIKLIEKIDIAGQQEKLEIITLLYASCVELAEKLKQLFPTTTSKPATGKTSPKAPPPTQPGQPPSVPEVPESEEDITSIKISQIIPYERNNSLIVIGTEKGITSLRELIKDLDVEDIGLGPKGKFHVYRLEHANADELSTTLQSLITGTKRADTVQQKQQKNQRKPPAKTATATEETNEEFEGEVKITPDPPTNSLVITASSNDFSTMLSLIKQLDIKRKQVFVESLLMEITLSDGTELGTTYNFITDKINQKATAFGGKTSPSLNALSLSPTALTGLALGFRTKDQLKLPAGLGGAEIDVPLVSALISASANSSMVNILSTPHILTTDNEEAEIIVGSKVPFVSGRFQDNNNNPQFSFSREDVGITLNLKPQVSSTNYVSMQLKVTISEVTAEDTEAGITTSNRTAKTSVVVKDQQTVVLGGLMKNQKKQVIDKIPFLGDIPLIGWLFKNVNNKRDRTNLLIFLTPYVISDTTQLNGVFFNKLRQRQTFLEENEFEESEEFKDMKDRGKQMLLREEEQQYEEEQLRLREAEEALKQSKEASDDAVIKKGLLDPRSTFVPSPKAMPVEGEIEENRDKVQPGASELVPAEEHPPEQSEGNDQSVPPVEEAPVEYIPQDAQPVESNSSD